MIATRSTSDVVDPKQPVATMCQMTASANKLRSFIAIGLLAIAAAFGLRSMLSFDVIVDETAHLASWRNRYSGDMVSPYLVRTFETSKATSPDVRKRVLDAYLDHPTLRFMTYWLTDSPTYSTIAEIARAASGSSVYALRGVSLAIALLTIPLLLRLGRLCWDDELGYLLASLFVVAPMIQFYAGIGRWYTLIQFTMFLLMCRYVIFHRNAGASPAPVFLAALLAQSVHPAQWFTVFPFVAGTAFLRWRRGASIKALGRETWWYVCGSVAMLVLMKAIVTASPTARGNLRVGFDGIRNHLDLVSPFGALTGLDGWASSWASVGIFIVLICFGGWAVTRYALRYAGLGYVGVAGLLMAVLGAYVVGSTPRHLLVHLPIPLVLAGIGMRAILGGGKRARLYASAMVLVLICLSIFFPINGYKRMLPGEGRYSEIAAYLQRTMKADDKWVAWPYYYSNPLYGYARLSEPFLPINLDDFKAFVSRNDRAGSLYVLTTENSVKASPLLSALEPVARFPRYSGEFVVYVINGQMSLDADNQLQETHVGEH